MGCLGGGSDGDPAPEHELTNLRSGLDGSSGNTTFLLSCYLFYRHKGNLLNVNERLGYNCLGACD